MNKTRLSLSVFLSLFMLRLSLLRRNEKLSTLLYGVLGFSSLFLFREISGEYFFVLW